MLRPAPPGTDRLTEREREVLGLVAAGLSNDDIAKQLHVSPHTAKTHVNRIMTKLGTRDRAQPVVVAYQMGFTRSWNGHGRCAGRDHVKRTRLRTAEDSG
ncbi:response regulator transcription factor [Streptomyces sp. NPDC050509]|uniref:response regulator transcription factor n=1 Tax=Streptomyces sp. NPDC050509 TaxID=3365620 RepID=UPI00378FD670